MRVDKLPPVKTSLKPSNHPYLSGPWTPQHEEVDAFELEVLEGAIPTDIDGIYLRNTENPAHQPLGRHHPFDGDGMIHQIAFSGGKATYRNRFIRTRGFEAEQIAGESLWGGLADPPGVSKRPGFGAHGGLKDTASTDVVVHNGKAIATFYQCGEGYVLDPETLENQGIAPWVPLDGISAHPKVDEATGELMFFNYSKHPPYMHYGVVDADGKLVTYVPIELPGPRLPHDMCFSENWSILNDLPVFWDAELMKHRNLHAVRLHEGVPSRFALIPRHGTAEDVRWFEAEPTYVLHWLNAYEEGDEVILDGYFQDNPTPKPEGFEQYGEHAHMMAYLDQHSLGIAAASLAVQPQGRHHHRGTARRSHRRIRHDQPAIRRPQISLCLLDHGEARLVPVRRVRKARSRDGRGNRTQARTRALCVRSPLRPAHRRHR